MMAWSFRRTVEHGGNPHTRRNEHLERRWAAAFAGHRRHRNGGGPRGGPLAGEERADRGALWAPAIVALADTLCAYGVSTVWPEGATAFTTVELKCNFMGTLGAGAVKGVAQMLHGGRTTQVWDATLTNEETGKLLAVFRCTQIIIYPKA
jgi:uncharacterized protein (TIGR00369 family)